MLCEVLSEGVRGLLAEGDAIHNPALQNALCVLVGAVALAVPDRRGLRQGDVAALCHLAGIEDGRLDRSVSESGGSQSPDNLLVALREGCLTRLVVSVLSQIIDRPLPLNSVGESLDLPVLRVRVVNVCRGDNRDSGLVVDLLDLLVEELSSLVVVEQLDLKVVAVSVHLPEGLGEAYTILEPFVHSVSQAVI